MGGQALDLKDVSAVPVLTSLRRGGRARLWGLAARVAEAGGGGGGGGSDGLQLDPLRAASRIRHAALTFHLCVRPQESNLRAWQSPPCGRLPQAPWHCMHGFNQCCSPNSDVGFGAGGHQQHRGTFNHGCRPLLHFASFRQ